MSPARCAARDGIGAQGGHPSFGGESLAVRLHATYDETITRALNVYEEVNRDVPFAVSNGSLRSLRAISDRNIERIKALGGGIAIQHRMAFQGDYFVNPLRCQAS